MLMMTPPLLRYFWFHSIYSLADSCSLQSAVCKCHTLCWKSRCACKNFGGYKKSFALEIASRSQIFWQIKQNFAYLPLVTRDLSAGREGVALQATVENKRLRMRNKILKLFTVKYWDLRTLNNIISDFSFNEMDTKYLQLALTRRVQGRKWHVGSCTVKKWALTPVV